MKRAVRKVLGWSLGLIALFVVACNLSVIFSARGKCYGSVEEIPKSDYGILLGTGRSAKSSPYYDARIEAAVELLKAGKIEALVISGENLYEDYHEVDSMVAEIRRAVPEVSMALVDADGTNTIESLRHTGYALGYGEHSYTIISQHFHNQRAVYLASWFFGRENISAFDARDTDKAGWRLRNTIRECLARVKAVLMM